MSCREIPSHQRWTMRQGRVFILSVYNLQGMKMYWLFSQGNILLFFSIFIILKEYEITLNAHCLLCLRFLLVGQTMPTSLDEDLTKDGIEALSSRPFRNVSRQTSRQMSLCGTPEKSSYRQLSVSDRSSIRVEEIIPAARVAIQVSSWWTQQVPSTPCLERELGI
jgi:hypothetical protein